MNHRKRIAALTAVLSLVFFSVALLTGAQKPDAEKEDLAKDLIGTWVSVGTPDDVGEAPEKGGGLKYFTGRHWTVTTVDPKNMIAVSVHGGTYTIEGDTYSETVEYASPNAAHYVGKTFKFKLEIKDDTYTQTGINNPFNAVLKRLK